MEFSNEGTEPVTSGPGITWHRAWSEKPQKMLSAQKEETHKKQTQGGGFGERHSKREVMQREMGTEVGRRATCCE